MIDENVTNYIKINWSRPIEISN